MLSSIIFSSCIYIFSSVVSKSMTRSQIVKNSFVAERKMISLLRVKLPNGGTRQMDYKSPYDVVCCGKRIELKTAGFLEDHWQFNIHRHGKLNEASTDVYILRLEGVPGFKAAICLIVPAPIGQPTISISLRSLLTRWSRFYDRFDFIDPEWKPNECHTVGPKSQ